MKTRLTALFGSTLFLLILSLPATAQYRQPEWYGYGFGPWHMWGGWGFGWMFPLFFLIVIVFLVFIVGSRVGWHRQWGAPGDPTFTALQILNERFAKGEIQKQEYEEKKSAILSGRR